MAETVDQVRRDLPDHVQRFRREGPEAEVVVFGEGGRMEAVLVPYEAFRLLIDLVEDVLITETTRERTGSDNGERLSLREVLERFAVDGGEL